jgi:hypothetical protein
MADVLGKKAEEKKGTEGIKNNPSAPINQHRDRV